MLEQSLRSIKSESLMTATMLDHPAETVSSNGSNSARRTLLVVDDEEGPRQSLRIVFKDEYNMLLADSGARALELIREHSVSAAVLDIKMSGMSGVDLLGKLKEIDPAIQVIMLTAYETIETARQALRLGACDYLTKPFDLSTIRAAVANAMERHAVADEIRANNSKLTALQEELHSQRLQEEIVRTKGEIYASIIHDINGPLTIISGFVEIINQHLVERDTNDHVNLELVRDRLNRITRQVNSCIEISRRYLGYLDPKKDKKGSVGVNQILADVRELLRVHPNAHKNELSVRLLPDDIIAEINGTDLMQVLLNLIINALQCTAEPHRVDVHGKRATGPIDLSQLQDGPESCLSSASTFANTASMLAVSVQDNGPGIPPEVLPRVFETYFTTKAGNKGTGLGLSIVQRLVTEAGGAVHVQTKPGHGTTFTVYLPSQ
jgi:signal transduction histidine kinase